MNEMLQYQECGRLLSDFWLPQIQLQLAIK